MMEEELGTRIEKLPIINMTDSAVRGDQPSLRTPASLFLLEFSQ